MPRSTSSPKRSPAPDPCSLLSSRFDVFEDVQGALEYIESAGQLCTGVAVQGVSSTGSRSGSRAPRLTHMLLGMTRNNPETTRAALAKRLRERAAVKARDQGGVISRDQLAALEIGHRFVRQQIDGGRWRAHGQQTIAIHTGDLSDEALRRRAVWEVGENIAQLDGVSALQDVGLKNFNETRVFVSVVHKHNTRPVDGVVVKKVIRRVHDESLEVGLRRTRVEVAAIRAAMWAVSDRQAALIMVMAVQQRLTTGDRLVEASIRVRRRARRAFIHRVALDIADGAQSLGELDFTGLCRKHGLPEPTRQAIRTGDRGRVYLDAAWEDIGWAVEIDGSHHHWGLGDTEDAFRQNDVMLGEERLLRMTLLGLRLEEDRFMRQVSRAHQTAHRRAA